MLAAIAVTFLLTYVALRGAVSIALRMGRSTSAVLQRVLGLVLAAMSIHPDQPAAVERAPSAPPKMTPLDRVEDSRRAFSSR